MTDSRPTLLRALLRQKHWQKYATFCAQYDQAARSIDPELVGSWPSRAQLQRWMAGSVRSLPYPDHCRILEAMFPGHTVQELVAPSDECGPAAGGPVPGALATNGASTLVTETPVRVADPTSQAAERRHADLTAVYPSRAEFVSAMPPRTLFDDATEIRAMGLSLNVLCQHYPDRRLLALVERGMTLQCLFLDPQGEAIQAREHEEGHPAGDLSTLTALNIQFLNQRVRQRLPIEFRDRVQIATYDETVRFNIMLIDGETCVVQPYLPEARGVDSPTFIATREDGDHGLYETFDQVFRSTWQRGKLR